MVARLLPGSPLEGLGAGGEWVRGRGHGSGNLARQAMAGMQRLT
jgi:hypothetical protein